MAVSICSSIASPFMPSLLHLAAVRMAASLHNDFEEFELDNAFHTIGNKLTFSDLKYSYSHWINECSEVMKSVFFIPAHLRKAVLNAVHGLKNAAEQWCFDQREILYITFEDRVFYWRSDGSMDGIKTAQQVVFNTNFDIVKRFVLACKYCLEDSILKLWTDLEIFGITESLELNGHTMVNFWVSWIRDGSERVSWRQAAREFFKDADEFIKLEVRHSLLLPLFRPEERKKFFYSLRFAEYDDYLLCLYAMSKKEENEILMVHRPIKLLDAYLEWPRQSLFLKIFNKAIPYEYDFFYFLDVHFHLRILERDFDYYELFVDLWDMISRPARERARESAEFPHLGRKIDEWLNEIRRRRKAYFDERRNKKINAKSVVHTPPKSSEFNDGILMGHSMSNKKDTVHRNRGIWKNGRRRKKWSNHG